MKYKMLLWPHANARYQNETLKLAESELRIMLSRVAEAASIRAEAQSELPGLIIESSIPLSADALEVIRCHSLLYALFEWREDDSLKLVATRTPAWLGLDLPAILKYKGKTNEMFLHLLINVALYSGDYWRSRQNLEFLDPMCGRATSLFVAVNRHWNATGTDIDKGDLKEAEQFFKRYLEYHRFKHLSGRQSLTLLGKRSAPVNHFVFSDTAEHFKDKDVASLRLVNADAGQVCEAFGKKAFHIIACDLPYGVQHGAHNGKGAYSSLEPLLMRVMPDWREALKPGGTVAVSFNAQQLKQERLRQIMEKAGLEVLRGEAYDHFSHWVEQAVTRDIAIGRRKN